MRIAGSITANSDMTSKASRQGLKPDRFGRFFGTTESRALTQSAGLLVNYRRLVPNDSHSGNELTGGANIRQSDELSTTRPDAIPLREFGPKAFDLPGPDDTSASPPTREIRLL